MLFLQFVQYSSSFVGTPKNEIPGAALELCQLNIKQFSPEILKFSTKQEDNPFTLNCYRVPRTFVFIFHAGSRRLVSNNFQNSSYKEKTAGSAHISRLSFRFLWLWLEHILQNSNKHLIFRILWNKLLVHFDDSLDWKPVGWWFVLKINWLILCEWTIGINWVTRNEKFSIWYKLQISTRNCSRKSIQSFYFIFYTKHCFNIKKLSIFIWKKSHADTEMPIRLLSLLVFKQLKIIYKRYPVLIVWPAQCSELLEKLSFQVIIEKRISGLPRFESRQYWIQAVLGDIQVADSR